jgi:hypothetical protein
MSTYSLPDLTRALGVFNSTQFNVDTHPITLEECLLYFIKKAGADIVRSFLLFTNQTTYLNPLVLSEEAEVQFDTYTITKDGINGLSYEVLPRLGITDDLQPQLTELHTHKTAMADNSVYFYALLVQQNRHLTELRREITELKREAELNRSYRRITDGHTTTLQTLWKTLTTLILKWT